MSADVHCPECGALTRVDRQDDGDEVLVCTEDECPRVVVSVLSRRYASEVKPDLDDYLGFAR